MLCLVLWPSYLYDGPAPQATRQNAPERAMSLSADERCIAWAIHDEARGEPLMGARAVMDVILKRSKTRGKSACQVIAEPHQFSGYKRGSMKNISPEALARFRKVREMRPVAENAEYFHATHVQPSWAESLKVVARIGEHVFYSGKVEYER